MNNDSIEPTDEKTLKDFARENINPNDDYLLLAGHDNALLGATKTHDGSSVLIYDEAIVLQNLMEDMDFQEAKDFFEFNILGSYVGPNTPIFLNRFTAKELFDLVKE